MNGSIIEALYQHYLNNAGCDSEEITNLLHEINAYIESFQIVGFINANDQETLYDSVLHVCELHTKAGFIAGLQMAYQFASELRKD